MEVQASNPSGEIISATQNQIGPDAFYTEDNEVVPGSKQVRIMIFTNNIDPNNLGDYVLKMTALDDLTYWVEHFVSGETGVQFTYDVPNGVMANGETQQVDTRLEGSGVQLVVPMDLQPASAENLVNADPNGIVSVAILTTPTFDASGVDPQTVVIDGVGVAFGTGGNPLASMEDVDGDGDSDLLLQMDYSSPDTG